ncbi:MAG: alpha/beta hydrolase [Betaproteobacteria bacterium]|nr:alpha/beta hydrolase [Betaproteobacteria bacterium]
MLIQLNGQQLETLTLDAPEGAPRGLAPIVFLHEGLGSAALWKDFPQQVCAATGRAGVVYSRRGYGQSSPLSDVRGAGRRTPQFMHDEAWQVLPALLHALGIEQPVLLGHSDGGSIALLHAARHTVQACIVMAPHLYVEQLSVDSIAQAKVAYETTGLRDRLARYHRDVDSAFWGWNDIWLAREFRDWTIEDEVAQVRCPLLAIQGENDEYGTMRQIDRIADLAPQARLLKLAACGHSPQRDQPQAVIDAVAAFLAAQAISR